MCECENFAPDERHTCSTHTHTYSHSNIVYNTLKRVALFSLHRFYSEITKRFQSTGRDISPSAIRSHRHIQHKLSCGKSVSGFSAFIGMAHICICLVPSVSICRQRSAWSNGERHQSDSMANINKILSKYFSANGIGYGPGALCERVCVRARAIFIWSAATNSVFQEHGQKKTQMAIWTITSIYGGEFLFSGCRSIPCVRIR